MMAHHDEQSQEFFKKNKDKRQKKDWGLNLEL